MNSALKAKRMGASSNSGGFLLRLISSTLTATRRAWRSFRIRPSEVDRINQSINQDFNVIFPPSPDCNFCVSLAAHTICPFTLLTASPSRPPAPFPALCVGSGPPLLRCSLVLPRRGCCCCRECVVCLCAVAPPARCDTRVHTLCQA